MFAFTKDCVIGIPELDEEHLKIFDMIAKIEQRLENDEISVPTTMELINELKQYSSMHFVHEEVYMESIHDPELGRQKLEHAAFTKKINSYHLSEVNEENCKEIYMELLEFLSKWLMGHILGSDILIGHFQHPEKTIVPVFDERFEIGIPQIDEEHKELFNIIKKLYVEIESEYLYNKTDVILEIMDELREHAYMHFANEELYMESIEYSGLEQHIKAHQNLIDKLNKLEQQTTEETQDVYLYEFLGLMQEWLIDHTLKMDKLIPKLSQQ